MNADITSKNRKYERGYLEKIVNMNADISISKIGIVALSAAQVCHANMPRPRAA